jgi:methylmalonyl-CoA/ethylmalonyl-CoA epimerase
MSLPNFNNDFFLDHIAIAVKNLDSSQKIFEDMGLVFNPHREIVDEQKVKTAFAKIDQHAQIELLEPTSSESSIQKFIDNKGEGIHHLCFQVKDVVAKQNELESKGYKFIYENPKIGAHDMLVNFIHPKSTGGVLIELAQKRETHK